ncbi:MAG: hypothetical protein IJS01_10200 [Lentisphaeria bacterium]|nr:hypothetical protein [Lentisphaeria bacterium]
MSENVWILAVGLAASGVGALILLLLGIIIHEIRQLRTELKDCVPDKMCKIMMAEHEKDIREIKKVIGR